MAEHRNSLTYYNLIKLTVILEVEKRDFVDFPNGLHNTEISFFQMVLLQKYCSLQ